MQQGEPGRVFARGDRILFRPWWSDREVVEAEELARYATRRTYYCVPPTASDPHVRMIRDDCIVAPV